MLRLGLPLMLVFGPAMIGQESRLPDVSYDPRAPLALRQALVKDLGFATLFDVSYDSPRGGRVTAYAVVPAIPRAGIVWQHWGQGDRSSMLPEAIAMARRGAASILINWPTLRPNPPQPKTPEEGLALWLQGAVDLRRAADALLDEYHVPAAKLAYVGHSTGATLGGIIALGERRFRALVLMGGYASISETGNPALAEKYAALDAERYIGRAAPAALLLQFARYDRFVTEEQANRYIKAASDPKQVRWYDCGHEFNDAQSAADRENWLAEHLTLSKK